jgi:hypothetical protein
VAPCKICDGAGVVEREGKLYECECAELRRIYASMPAYVRSAIVKKEHIEAVLPSEKIRIIDAVDRSIYVTASWADMRAIIKTVMVVHRDKFIRIISDREIRDVYVGSASRKARGENSSEPIYNSIEDLVKPPTLLMIRLNEIGAPNRAAAGILEEALCYRLDRSKPVWLLSNATKPFGAGSYAYSENVWSLMMSLPKVRIAPIHPLDGAMDITGNVEQNKSGSVAASPLSPELAPAPAPAPAPARVTSTPRRQIRPARDTEDTNDSLGGLAGMGSGIKRSFKKS